MTLIELQALAKRLGMPGFAAKQIASWLYEKKVTSIDEMTNLSLKHRELLKQNYEVGVFPPVDETEWAITILLNQFIFRMTTGRRYVSLHRSVAR